MVTKLRMDNPSNFEYWRIGICAFLFGMLIVAAPALLGSGGKPVVDPGADPKATPRAGGPLPELTAEELEQLNASLNAFTETDSVKGTFVSPVFGAETDLGLGPRFNSNRRAVCHVQPAPDISKSQ